MKKNDLLKDAAIEFIEELTNEGHDITPTSFTRLFNIYKRNGIKTVEDILNTETVKGMRNAGYNACRLHRVFLSRYSYLLNDHEESVDSICELGDFEVLFDEEEGGLCFVGRRDGTIVCFVPVVDNGRVIRYRIEDGKSM